MHVVIAGGGIAGLCLAHGLRRAGISCAVYERDATAEPRAQGYRIHIDANGGAALARCLPPDLFALYLATSDRGGARRRMSVLDERGREVFVRDFGPPPDPARDHSAVNRLTLRQILLGDLGEIVYFGHTVTAVSEDAHGVRAVLADGTEVSGDVLVAADGVGSVIHRWLLPGHTVHDTGLRCIYGRTELRPDLAGQLPARLFDGFTGVTGPDRRTLALGAFRARTPPDAAAARYAPDVHLDPVPDYLMWATVAPITGYGRTDAQLWTADGPALHATACELVAGWHPEIVDVVTQGDPTACFPITIRTVTGIPAWQTRRVTVIGDAIHPMSPAGGQGANTALWDAAALSEALAAAHRGELPVLAAISDYEHQMRSYATAVVAQSLNGARNLPNAPSPSSPVPAGGPGSGEDQHP